MHEGGVGAARQVVHEQAVAQAALAEGRHGRQPEVAHQGLEHDGAGDDDVGAVGVEAGHAAALLERQAAQQLDHLAHVGEARRLVALRLAVVQHAGGDRGHVAHRARGAVGDVDVEAAHGRPRRAPTPGARRAAGAGSRRPRPGPRRRAGRGRRPGARRPAAGCRGTGGGGRRPRSPRCCRRRCRGRRRCARRARRGSGCRGR